LGISLTLGLDTLSIIVANLTAVTAIVGSALVAALCSGACGLTSATEYILIILLEHPFATWMVVFFAHDVHNA
jgi:hypothetical protein